MADRTYRLIVEGELSDDLALAFPGMALTRADGSTALTGTVRDQAELQGLLQRTSDLGLTLLEAKAIDDSPGPPASPDRPSCDYRKEPDRATTAEKSIEQELDKQGAPKARANCPDTITVKLDTTVTCEFSGASGQAAGT